MKKILSIIGSFLIFGVAFVPTAQAETFATIQGSVTPPSGFSLGSANINAGSGYSSRVGYRDGGNFEIYVPVDQAMDVSVYFSLTSDNIVSEQHEALFSTRLTFKAGERLDIQIPKPVQLDISMVDGKDQLVSNGVLELGSEFTNLPADPFTDSSGRSWSVNNLGYVNLDSGRATAWFQPDSSFEQFKYSVSRGGSGRFTPTFELLQAKSIKLCLPINVDSSGLLPEGCLGEDDSDSDAEDGENQPPSVTRITAGKPGDQLKTGGFVTINFTVEDDKSLTKVQVILKNPSGGIVNVFSRDIRSLKNYASSYIASLPANSQAGAWSIDVIATDSDGLSTTQSLPTLNIAEGEDSSEEESSEGTVKVQRAGSQIVLLSEGVEGEFFVFDGVELVGKVNFSQQKRSAVIEQRPKAEITLSAVGEDPLPEVQESRELLWFDNYSIGKVNTRSGLNDYQTLRLDALAAGLEPYDGPGDYTDRPEKVTKFICTGIYGPGASMTEKIEARKKAKIACEFSEKVQSSVHGPISFWFQTKETSAPSYVGKVLITVKGLANEVLFGLG